jgi:hypothetical protein
MTSKIATALGLLAVIAACFGAAAPANARPAPAHHRVTDAQYRVVIEQRLVAEDDRSHGAITALKTTFPEGYAKLVDVLVEDRQYIDMDSPGEFQADVREHMGETMLRYRHGVAPAPVAQLKAMMLADATVMQQLRTLDPRLCEGARQGHINTAVFLTPETFGMVGDMESATFRAARAALDHPTAKRDITSADYEHVGALLAQEDLAQLQANDPTPSPGQCAARIHLSQAVAGLSDADAEPWLGLYVNRPSNH